MISTRDLFNKWLGMYGKKSSYRIAWEHNHHHNDIKYANNVVESCKNLDTLVLVSDSLRNYYKKEMKEKNYKCRCVFIPNMLDLIPDTVSTLEETRIISVGRLSKEKGFCDLVDVYKEFKDKNPDTTWYLDIVGNGADRNKVADRIYSYKLNNDVTMHGYLKKKELNEILHESSIYFDLRLRICM